MCTHKEGGLWTNAWATYGAWQGEGHRCAGMRHWCTWPCASARPPDFAKQWTNSRATTAHGAQVEDVLMVHAYLSDLGALSQNEIDFALRVNDLSQPQQPQPQNGQQQQQQQAAGGSQLLPALVPTSPRPPAPAHRAAVCVTGMFRAGPFLYPWHVTHVLSYLGMPYDVYVSTPDLPGAFPSSSDYTYFLQPHQVVHANYSRVDALLALPGWESTGFKGVHSPGKWLRQIMVSEPRVVEAVCAFMWWAATGCAFMLLDAT